MQSSMLSSRIRESAAGLAKDLFPNSINGYGALETTNELATLSSAHKLSSPQSYGTPSSPQLSQTLKRRRYPGSASLRSSDLHDELNTASDAYTELSDFLLQNCSIGESSASSSQSDLTLDLSLASGETTEPGHRDQLRRNDSFEPELSRSKQKSPARSWHMYTKSSQQVELYGNSALESSSEEVFPAWYNSEMREGRQQELPLGYHTKAISQRAIPDTASARRKEMALSRLNLIFSQMPAATQSLSFADSRQTDALESSYNQICGGGGDAQEWAEFEASLFRTYGEQSQVAGQDLVQRQQHEQITNMTTGRQAPMEANILENHMLQGLRPSREGPVQQNQTLEKDEEKSQSTEPMIEFHCPWIDCHSRFQQCTDYIRDTDNPDNLPCAHSGCELEFATEQVWRKHVSIAHHNLLPIVQPVAEADMEAAWENTQS